MTPRFEHRSHAIMVGLLGATLCSMPCVEAVAETYTSPRNGYSVELPEAWIRIPDDQLQAEAPPASDNVEWEAAYQLPLQSGWFVYPYMILQYSPYQGAQVSERGMVKYLNTIAGTNPRRIKDGNFSQELRNQTPDNREPIFDLTHRRFAWQIEKEIFGVPLRGVMVGHFGRFGVTYILFYVKEQDWPAYQGTVDDLVKSLRFDDEHAWDEKYLFPGRGIPAPQNAPPGPGILVAQCVGVLAGIAGLVTAWLLYGARSRGQPPRPPKESSTTKQAGDGTPHA